MQLNLNTIDFNYILDADYDRSECVCDPNDYDYCRCTSIINARIDDYDIKKVVDTIYNQYYDDTTVAGKRNIKINGIINGISYHLDKYFIYRLLVINKVFNDGWEWEFDISGGYYGEEMNSVSMDSFLATKLNEQVDKVIKFKTIKEKVDYCLELEYGELTQRSIDCKEYEIIDITLAVIDEKSMNTDHIKTVKNETNYYSDYPKDLPRGIVRKTANGYAIVDGYHRIYGLPDKTKGFKVLLMK